MGILPKIFTNLPQGWSLCTWPPRVPRPSRDTRADRDTWIVWGSPGPAGTRATRVFSSWLLITHRTLYKTHLSSLTLLVTHFNRVQLLSRGDIFSNNSDYQVLTGCRVHVPSSSRVPISQAGCCQGGHSGRTGRWTRDRALVFSSAPAPAHNPDS